MLVHSVQMQGRKTLAHDNLDTSATHTDLVRDVTDSIKMAAVTAVSRDFKTRQKLTEEIAVSGFFLSFFLLSFFFYPQWETADAEMKVPSVENTGLKGSPFEALSRPVYNYTCYAYCHGFLPCLFLPFWSIHLHFFQNLSNFFLRWLWLTPVPV